MVDNAPKSKQKKRIRLFDSRMEKIADSISDKDFDIIKRLINYRSFTGEKSKNKSLPWFPTSRKYIEILNKKKLSNEGWLFGCSLTKGIIDIAHRSMYLQGRLIKKAKLLDRKKVIFSTKERKIKGDPYVYKLKKDDATPIEIFLIFYRRGIIWQLMDSDYFNDTLGPDTRFLILLQEYMFNKFYSKKKKFPSDKNAKKDVNKLMEMSYGRELLMPPSMIYSYLKNSKSAPDDFTLKQEYFGFLMYDYKNCDDDYWRNELKNTLLKLLKSETKLLKSETKMEVSKK